MSSALPRVQAMRTEDEGCYVPIKGLVLGRGLKSIGMVLLIPCTRSVGMMCKLHVAVAADPRTRLDQGIGDLGVGFGERRDVAAQMCRVEGREQVADP